MRIIKALSALCFAAAFAVACSPAGQTKTGETTTTAAAPAGPRDITPANVAWKAIQGQVTISQVTTPEAATGAQFPAAGGDLSMAFAHTPVTAGQNVTAHIRAWSTTPVRARFLLIRHCAQGKEEAGQVFIDLTTTPQDIEVPYTFLQAYPCVRLDVLARGAQVYLTSPRLFSAS